MLDGYVVSEGACAVEGEFGICGEPIEDRGFGDWNPPRRESARINRDEPSWTFTRC